ncbi:MAG: polysaccharide biosynthesis C-terminal domain-containing protein, partial [Lutibacter sp.]|nr:polysaccharide biosynthesis C-terminal domain-containing protein [Lutibacter sp.]
VSKLIELALGTGNAILLNSKYYKIFFYLSLAMAISVIFLNKWLIDLIGINGAAIATLIVVAMYSLLKIIYLRSKLNIQPFDLNTIKLAIIISAIFAAFYFWNFSFHPIINIGLKAVIISLLYFLLINKLQISKDINGFVSKYVSKNE